MVLVLRRVTADDSELLWRWSNEQVTRAKAFNSESIQWELHYAWFKRKLNSPNSRIWILEKEDQAAGQIRYDRNGNCAEIHLMVATAFRGQGLGSILLRRSLLQTSRELGVRNFFGLVKAGNNSSARVFEKTGFKLAERLLFDGQPCLKFVHTLVGE